MSLNSSCDNDSPSFPDDNHTGQTEHFPGLETVTLPEDLYSQIKEYIGFTVSFNKDNKTPNYVAWELLGDEVKNDIDRTDNFWTDPDIEGCPSTKDYTRSGYDRGQTYARKTINLMPEHGTLLKTKSANGQNETPQS